MATRAFGPYRVVEELGSGSLSTVYRAVQEPLGRGVAIKALKSTIHPSSPFALQLEREARVLSSLRHPNVVMLYDFVKTQTQMWLVLELVDGFSLATVIGKRARFSAEFAATIGLEMARGLAHAHERGVVHRDVKPANVLVSKGGEVKLGDFGIAQRERLPSADEPLVRPTKKGEADAAFGTPAYMSPEQILGEMVDARSDVFSLGVVLYQLLAGSRPFDRDGEQDKRAATQRIRRDPAPPLRDRAPEVPRALERIVMRCLEKLPTDRFSGADEVADLLESYVHAQTSDEPEAIVVRTLVAAGLVEGDAKTDRWRVEEKRPPVKGTLLGFAAMALAFTGGAGALEWSASSARAAAQAGSRPLELTPQQAGALRVVATPWAEVWVDGQKIDVTPMARPIPLAAGPHYVTLTCPKAPPEKRQITVNTGETITLDVAMKVAPEKDGGPGEGVTTARTDAHRTEDGGR
ncbi:MAG TPA: serine/threonine-protein kinase [Polyangiaceae bacterium]